MRVHSFPSDSQSRPLPAGGKFEHFELGANVVTVHAESATSSFHGSVVVNGADRRRFRLPLMRRSHLDSQ